MVQHGLCAGCGLCAAIGGDAVGMRLRAPGYARPEQTGALTAAQERQIAEACPGSVVAPWSGDAPDPLWGPSLQVHTGHATDDAVRHAASSGGVLSALAIHALQSGLADRVVHVAMDAAAPLLTTLQTSMGRDQVIAAAGSRYGPATPLADIVVRTSARRTADLHRQTLRRVGAAPVRPDRSPGGRGGAADAVVLLRRHPEPGRN